MELSHSNSAHLSHQNKRHLSYTMNTRFNPTVRTVVQRFCGCDVCLASHLVSCFLNGLLQRQQNRFIVRPHFNLIVSQKVEKPTNLCTKEPHMGLLLNRECCRGTCLRVEEHQAKANQPLVIWRQHTFIRCERLRLLSCIANTHRNTWACSVL